MIAKVGRHDLQKTKDPCSIRKDSGMAGGVRISSVPGSRAERAEKSCIVIYDETWGFVLQLKYAMHPVCRCDRINHGEEHNRNAKEKLFRLHRILQYASRREMRPGF